MSNGPFLFLPKKKFPIPESSGPHRKVRSLLKMKEESEIETLSESRHEAVDRVEEELSQLPQVACPVENIFTPGLYTRITTLPKGTLVTSEIHKTEHPFFVLKGKVEVGYVESGEVVYYEAPCVGVTKPGTRRILLAIEDTVWVTCHVTEETDIEKIGDEILEQDRPVVGQYKNKEIQGVLSSERKQIEL